MFRVKLGERVILRQVGGGSQFEGEVLNKQDGMIKVKAVSNGWTATGNINWYNPSEWFILARVKNPDQSKAVK